MGYIVSCENKEIWTPSLTVGSLYFEQVQSLEKILEKESGIIQPFDDELEINKEIFENFINVSLDFLRKSNNSELLALISGCVEVSIYIYYLITDNWLETPFELHFLKEKAKSMANFT